MKLLRISEQVSQSYQREFLLSGVNVTLPIIIMVGFAYIFYNLLFDIFSTLLPLENFEGGDLLIRHLGLQMEGLRGYAQLIRGKDLFHPSNKRTAESSLP